MPDTSPPPAASASMPPARRRLPVFAALGRGWLEFLPAGRARPKNPALIVERHGMPTPAEASRRTLIWTLRVTGALLAAYGLAAAVVLLASHTPVYQVYSNPVSQSYFVYQSIWQALGWVFAISLMDKLVLDTSAVLAALNVFNWRENPAHWDLLRLTSLRAADLVEAKHAVAQGRIWRLMCTVAGLRLGVVVIAFLHLLVLPLLVPQQAGIISLLAPDGGRLLPEVYFFLALAGVAWAGLGVIYVVEPRWRLRALTLAGLAVSTRQGIAGGVLSALGVVLGVWVMQVVVGLLLSCGLIYSSTFILGDNTGSSGLGLILFAAAAGYAFYLLYTLLAGHWRREAVRRLVRFGLRP